MCVFLTALSSYLWLVLGEYLRLQQKRLENAQYADSSARTTFHIAEHYVACIYAMFKLLPDPF